MTMRVSPVPNSTVQSARPGTPHPRRRGLALALAGLGLLVVAAIGLAPAVASAPASAAPAMAVPESAAVSLSVPTDQKPAGLGCWVTGDLVWAPEAATNTDPAEVARAVCGGR